ncbi:MAG TPA: LytTR family DNA-binding domain-containing protein [Rhizomicrobium sp.]|jgi:hypothetical protein|nr:LytTR family DNA-binding domain-containing protein [Rhizomicrobium sp.]
MTATIAARSKPRLNELAFGFLYWLTFLLVLEPGNLASMTHVDWLSEAFRMTGAAAIGALATPFALALVRHYPVEGRASWRAALVELAGAFAISATLIFVSCVLADRFLPTEHRPFLTALPQELQTNGLLLVFCIVGILAIGHAMRRHHAVAQPTPRNEPAAQAAATIAVKERGQTIFVPLGAIDWIESQGNYTALHVSGATHLMRQTLASLEAELDPARFVRIHRRTIIARDRIAAIAPIAAGDAQLRLNDGTTLRLSRSYRANLQPPG